MDQSISWEPNRSLESKETPRIYETRMFITPIQKRPLTVRILGQSILILSSQ